LATRIRLKRYGAKHSAHYRVAVMDQKRPRDGRAIEEIGYYDPNTDPATIQIQQDRAQYWLSVGAQPSETVEKLFAKMGIAKPGKAVAGEPAASDEPAADES